MSVERGTAASSLLDVLDRVLDKGIVIDAWVRVSLVGIDLVTIEARVTVASIETYLKYADAFASRAPVTTTLKQVSSGRQVQVTDLLSTGRVRSVARR